MSVVSPSAALMSASRTRRPAGLSRPSVRKRYRPSGCWAPMRDQSAMVGELLPAPRVALIAAFVLEASTNSQLVPTPRHPQRRHSPRPGSAREKRLRLDAAQSAPLARVGWQSRRCSRLAQWHASWFKQTPSDSIVRSMMSRLGQHVGGERTHCRRTAFRLRGVSCDRVTVARRETAAHSPATTAPRIRAGSHVEGYP